MSDIQLAYDEFQRLVLTTSEGQTFVGVFPVRAFPFSAPTQCISFVDAAGREQYFLGDLQTLSAPVRTLLEADLAQREFIPVIRQIFSVSAGAEPTDWHVLTDRGETRFTLNNEDNIRRMGANGALVTDAHGVRFRIEDANDLDPHSLRILRRYL
ncbi:MAG: DUF1854 domain-containing protein [Planctomycetes bacterium]|nr:DUF1854 domain-containing protein [Planctomycetota bacterium]